LSAVELKAKFLQHLLKNREEQGFTLIELLVVIIIIGILAAIALPSFLNQANKAKQSEAKTYVGSVNRAQQAFYLEENEFATDMPTLGIGVPLTTDNYTYAITGGTDAQTSATPDGDLIGYGGYVWIEAATGTTAATSKAVLCTGTPATLPTINSNCT
jgi:prepilin-type N-terminal cleavage/methylation domain-containing protein